jgi:DNA-binding beta-propeller fold protein YncE
MNSPHMRRAAAILTFWLLVLAIYIHHDSMTVRAAGETRFAGPTSFRTLALNADGSVLAAVNPDNNSIFLLHTRPGTNQCVAKVSVGVEPNSPALHLDGTRAYVANPVRGTVSVVKIGRTNQDYRILALTPAVTSLGAE